MADWTDDLRTKIAGVWNSDPGIRVTNAVMQAGDTLVRGYETAKAAVKKRLPTKVATPSRRVTSRR